MYWPLSELLLQAFMLIAWYSYLKYLFNIAT